jgi:subtilase family serine protease
VEPSKSDALTITLTIKNQGSLKADGCYVSYYIDGLYQGNHYIEEIAPGASVTRTFPWTYLGKSLAFQAIIDKENSVIEGDESNNEKTAVIPAPDLTIEAITWSPAEYSENSTVTFLIMVRNDGAGQAESLYMDCYINDVLQSRLPVNSISPGASAAVIFYWKAQSGENVFKAIADGSDSITESDETNNEKTINLWDPGASTEVIPIPVVTNEEETTDNATSNETEESIPVIVENSELPPPAQDTVTAANISANISAASSDASPSLKNILMNRWIVIGVGVLGVASIAVLLLMRRRTKTA